MKKNKMETTWRYRVVKETDPSGQVFYTIREVYTTGKKQSTTIEPCYPFGQDIEELKADMELMMMAFEEEAIDIEDLKNKANNGK